MKVKTRLRLISPRSIVRRAYRHQARQYINSLNPQIDRSRKTILIINHFFDQDIRALQLANREYNLVAVDGPRLFKGGKIYFTDEVMRLQAPYADTPEKNRRRFRHECGKIFDQLRKRFDFRLIVTASDSFWWIREFIDIGRDCGIKTIVLDKEGTRSPYAVRGETTRINRFAPFISDHIFVWSERQRRFWMKVGVSDEGITIVGQPRSDLFHQERTNRLDAIFPVIQPLVCLFSYEDTAYIPPHLVQSRRLSWSRMKEETHEEFSRLSQRYPGYNFVVKTHPQQSDLVNLQTRYDRNNLAVIGGAEVANELILKSELIIAFQTTAIIEAMGFDKRIVYTAWDPLYAELAPDLIPFHDAPGIVVAESLDYFREVCSRFFSGDDRDFETTPETAAARRQFANEYFYMPDGHVCERFFDEVGRFLA
jgi:hypothetical protein